MTKFFKEAIAEAPVKRHNGRWLVAIATPGQGSSGYYAEDMLKEFGPKAFPAGAKAFINHESSRNPKDMIGTYPEGAYWDEDRKQLMGELETFSHWKEFVEEVGPHCGMSIYMAGKSDKEGNVTELIENIQNGADLVSYPGLDGSGIIEKLESARAGSNQPLVALTEEKDEQGKEAKTMTEEQFNELKTLLTAAIATTETKAQEAAQVEADEALAQERLDAFESAVEAIASADITEAQKKSLREQAKSGVDVKPLIEAQVELKAQILKEATEDVSEGRVSVLSGSKISSPWGSR